MVVGLSLIAIMAMMALCYFITMLYDKNCPICGRRMVKFGDGWKCLFCGFEEK